MRIEFQSSPARGGGCNPADVRRSRRRMGVSILTRPWGRVQQTAQVLIREVEGALISILTRPWGRVQRQRR